MGKGNERETLLDRIPPIGRIQQIAERNLKDNMSSIIKGSQGGPGLGGVSRATEISQAELWRLTWPPEELKLDSLSYDLANKIASSVGKTADELITKARKK